MKTEKTARIFFSYCMSFMPIISVITIVLFYIHATVILGRYPTYANPDPKDLGIYSFYGTISIVLLFATLFVLPILIITLIIELAESKPFIYWKRVLIFFVGIILMFCLTQTPIFEWFID